MPKIREYRFARLTKQVRAEFIADRPNLLAVDTETSGAAFYDDAFCVTLTWRRPAGMGLGRLYNGYIELGDIDFGEVVVQELLDEHEREGGELVFHNAKFDLAKLARGGMLDLAKWGPSRIHDTEAIWHLLYPNDLKSLDHLTANRLQKGRINVPTKSGPNKGKPRWVTASKYALKEALKESGMKAEDGYHLLPRTAIVPYSMKDTEYTYQLFELGYPMLKDGLLDAYRMEQEVTFALLAMEMAGMKLDLDYLTKITSDFGVRVMESAAKIAELADDGYLNPNAPEQLRKALAKRGVETASTDKEHLRGIDDDLAREVLNYRYLTKVHGDKLRPLLDEQRDGLVHPWIRQHGAKTGRTASGSAQIDG